MIKLIKQFETIKTFKVGLKVVNIGDGTTYQQIFTCIELGHLTEKWVLENKEGYKRRD